MSLNHELSMLFETMSKVMELKGENVFKAIAFGKVARALRDVSIDVKKCCDEGTLKEIEGIGDSSRKIIEQYVKEARSSDYDGLVTSVPASLLPMLQSPSLGAKTIALFWKERGVTSLDELKKALDEGKLEGIRGIGEKRRHSIKKGISWQAKSGGRTGM